MVHDCPKSTKARAAKASDFKSSDEEFALGIDPKSLHAMVLMQTVYNTVIQHSRGFLKHVVICVTEKGRITVA